MVTSAVDIVNLALGRIGESPIVGFSDPSIKAKTAEATYPLMRDSLQRRYRWNFCKSRVILAPLVEAPPFGEFRYFAKPSDFIATLGAYEGRWGSEGYSDQRDLLRMEGDKILWPGTSLHLYYMRRVEQEIKFDPLFADALAWSMAREFASALANDIKKAGQAEQMFDRTIKHARTANAMESAPEVLTASTWLDGRWGGAYGPREYNRIEPGGQPRATFPAVAPDPSPGNELEWD